MIKKNIVFVLRGNEATGNNVKHIIAVFNLEDQSKKELKLFPVDSTLDCYLSFFQWKGKIIMTPTSCPQGGNYNVKVFNENGTKGEDNDTPIAYLKEFLLNKNNFFTAFIEGKDVLLFTQKKDSTKTGDVYLWMYDGSRVAYVGIIDTETTGVFSGSFLYTDNELFVLHKKNNAEQNVFSLTRLKTQLDNITGILKAWKQSDDNIEKGCEATATTSVILCFTNGLVGFLSDKSTGDKKIWTDEYYYVNAKVSGGKKTDNGFRFDTPGAGAQWILHREKEEDQPYNFTNPGFTLAATVNIDKNADEGLSNSVLGVVFKEAIINLAGAEKSFKLWCSKKKKMGCK